jgi:thioesterase domain-containing protein
VAQYPSWREMCRAGAPFDVIINAVVAQVLATFGENDCLLAGYSFGGFVAWEVARRLMESGHRVAFVGLIDSRRYDIVKPPGSRSIGVLHSIFANPLSSLIRLLIRMSAFPILHVMGNVAMLLPAQMAFKFHSTLIANLRLRALLQSETRPLQIPATLFRSDEHFSISPDFGWGALCSNLDIVSIGGTHGSMLDPPNREFLCERFVEAIERARHKAKADAREIDTVVAFS